MKAYLNLGCGERFHPDWINVDLTEGRSNVISHDLVTGIPFAAESVDAVYHAALFEHIRRSDAANFLRETHRVLKPGGIVRVGVPDLEKICRTYLEKLEAALAGDKEATNDSNWARTTASSISQSSTPMLCPASRCWTPRIFTRNLIPRIPANHCVPYSTALSSISPPRMAILLRRQPLPNEQFIVQRIGHEGCKLIEEIRRQAAAPNKGLTALLYQRARAIAQALRDRLLTVVAGRKAAQAIAIGRFRLSGEVHHWMYDRFSLARELMVVGFHEPIVRSASESAIPDWSRFCLDVQSDGTINKPDLLFMEAIKPKTQANL